MSDTPETDAEETILASDKYVAGHYWIKRDFARKLERERNEARDFISNSLKADMPAIDRLAAERDQLRKVVDELAQHRMQCNAYKGLATTPDLIAYNSLPHIIERNKAK